jgi:hypothetical protein
VPLAESLTQPQAGDSRVRGGSLGGLQQHNFITTENRPTSDPSNTASSRLLSSRGAPSASRHLSLREAALVVEAVRGTSIVYARDFYSCVHEQIRVRGLDKKWKVDRGVLLNTLRCLRGRDVDTLMSCCDRWLEADAPWDILLYERSRFSRLLIPTRPVAGEVLTLGDPEDTLNRIDLAANQGLLKGEELVAFLEHRDPRVRQHAFRRLGSGVGPNASEEPRHKPVATAVRE